MTPRNRDTSLGKGVYFAEEDYVGMMRRVVIWIVDLIALAVVSLAFAIMYAVTPGDLSSTFVLLYLVSVWAYLTREGMLS